MLTNTSRSYRLGIFGCAASPAIRDDNEANGDAGVGNYGMLTTSFSRIMSLNDIFAQVSATNKPSLNGYIGTSVVSAETPSA